MKCGRPHPQLGGGRFLDFCDLQTFADGGGKRVKFSVVLCGRHICMLPNFV